MSSGRGGLGNINRSRSRDPAYNFIVYSSGDGGEGYIVADDGSISEGVDECELQNFPKNSTSLNS